jgi:hypothetical protein
MILWLLKVRTCSKLVFAKALFDGIAATFKCYKHKKNFAIYLPTIRLRQFITIMFQKSGCRGGKQRVRTTQYYSS